MMVAIGHESLSYGGAIQRGRSHSLHEAERAVPTSRRERRGTSALAQLLRIGSSMTSILRIWTLHVGSCCWKAKWPSVNVVLRVREVDRRLAVDLDDDVIADRLDLLGEPGVGRHEQFLDLDEVVERAGLDGVARGCC